MPSRRPTPSRSSRRAKPKLKLVRSPKGRKPALAAKKSARAVAVKLRLAKPLKPAVKPVAKPVKKVIAKKKPAIIW